MTILQSLWSLTRVLVKYGPSSKDVPLKVCESVFVSQYIFNV